MYMGAWLVRATRNAAESRETAGAKAKAKGEAAGSLKGGARARQQPRRAHNRRRLPADEARRPGPRRLHRGDAKVAAHSAFFSEKAARQAGGPPLDTGASPQ